LSDLLSTAWPAEEFEAWREEVLSSIAPIPLDRDPEWIAGRALVAAWERGLRRVLVLPAPGDLFQQISPHVVLVSQEKRMDAKRYSAALESFASQ